MRLNEISIQADISQTVIAADVKPIDVSGVINAGGMIKIEPEDIDVYDGETVVIPHANADVILPTKDKFVEQNITVREIPYYQTANPAGGNTAIIGLTSEVIENG